MWPPSPPSTFILGTLAPERPVLPRLQGRSLAAKRSALVGAWLLTHGESVELTSIYQCFSEPTRLRIMTLLCHGPLCVCHFQELLGEPQVKISKHLSYLRRHGLVEVQRERNWMIYSLPRRRPRALDVNLASLQACVRADPEFRRDLARLDAMREDIEKNSPICGAKASGKSRARPSLPLPGIVRP